MTAIPPSIDAKFLPASFLTDDGKSLAPGVTADQAITVAKGIQERVGSLPEAEGKLLIALLQSTDLAPSSSLSPADFNKALSKLESAASYLAGIGGKDTAELLARLLIEQAASDRKSALDNRLQARETAKSELLSQAGQMDKAAQEMMNGAITALVVGVVMAGVSMIMTGISIFQSAKNLGAMKDKVAEITDKASQIKDVANAMKDTTIIKNFSKEDLKTLTTQSNALEGQLGNLKEIAQKAGNLAQIGGTINQLGQTSGNAGNSMLQAESKKLDAEGSRDAASAQDAQALGDLAKEAFQALDELMKAIVNFLKEMAENEVNMMQSLTKV